MLLEESRMNPRLIWTNTYKRCCMPRDNGDMDMYVVRSGQRSKTQSPSLVCRTSCSTKQSMATWMGKRVWHLSC